VQAQSATAAAALRWRCETFQQTKLSERDSIITSSHNNWTGTAELLFEKKSRN
jgi:hypothetical protein